MAASESSSHQSRTTTSHEEIRRWVQARKGVPATVKGTEHGSEHVGILRIAFSDEDSLQPVQWEEFFDKFDKEQLAFLYQEETQDGECSRFFKFVQRD